MSAERGVWRITGASVTGTAHAKSRRKCEDAHRIEEFPDGAAIIAVADGAGSADRGGDGAKIAVEAAVSFLQNGGLVPDLARRESIESALASSLEAARLALEAEADRQALLLRDYATTLILLVAGPHVVAAAQVGDGASIVRSADGGLLALTNPGSDGYVNETTFLTSDNALASSQISVLSVQASGFAVFTDGLQMLALQMPECSPHAPFFAPLFQFAERTPEASRAQKELIEFLQSPRITQRTDDDLTLVLGTRVR